MTDQTSTVQQIDPTTLLLDRNIRVTTDLDNKLAASIREHGVLEPIIAACSTPAAAPIRSTQLRLPTSAPQARHSTGRLRVSLTWSP